MDIVVFDIDGTIADNTHRQHHLMGDRKNWDSYNAGSSRRLLMINDKNIIDQETLDAYKNHLRKLQRGPGGIMEMKQTISNKETEIDRLQKYKVFVAMIANEPWELSYEKIENQRNWWSKLARKLLYEVEVD